MTDLPDNVEVRFALEPAHDGYSLIDRAMHEALSVAEDRHFWQLTRNCFIADQLARIGVKPGHRILELGCGGGGVSAHLSRLGYEVTGVDGHLPLILQAAARAPLARFIVEDFSRRGSLSGESGFAGVGLFDVIEHFDEPVVALERALEHACSGGFVVGTVPALMALWSDADERSGHRLRYDRTSLLGLLSSVHGARDVDVIPFNRVLVPLLWAHRRLSDGKQAASGEQYYRVPREPLNSLLRAIVRTEHITLANVRAARAVPGASLWFSFRKAD